MVKGAPSVNPSGKPPGAAGLARYIASQTNDGFELVDKLLAIARSDDTAPRQREAAILALLDRLAGRPVTPIAAQIENMTRTTPVLPPSWSSLSADERRSWLQTNVPSAFGLASGGE